MFTWRSESRPVSRATAGSRRRRRFSVCLGAALLFTMIACAGERPEALAGEWYGPDTLGSGGRYEHLALLLLEDGRATLWRRRRENGQWLPRRTTTYVSWSLGRRLTGESLCLQATTSSGKRCGAVTARSRGSITLELPVDPHPDSVLSSVRLKRVVPAVIH